MILYEFCKKVKNRGKDLETLYNIGYPFERFVDVLALFEIFVVYGKSFVRLVEQCRLFVKLEYEYLILLRKCKEFKMIVEDWYLLLEKYKEL